MKRLMMLMKRLMILVMLLVSTAGFSQTGTFKTYTGGTQVSTETVDLVVPQQDLNAGTVDTAQLVDLSVTAEKINDGAVGTASVAVGYELLTTAEYDRSQNPPGSSTVAFEALTVNGVAPLTADERTYSFAVDQGITLVFGIGESRTTTVIGAGLNASYEVFITAPTGANTTDGIYYAITTSEGTTMAVSEITNAGFFTLDLDGVYLRVTNNTGKGLYSKMSVRRVQ